MCVESEVFLWMWLQGRASGGKSVRAGTEGPEFNNRNLGL